MRWASVLSLATGAGLWSAALSIAHEPAQDASASPLDSRDLASTIWNDIKNAADCAACEAVLVLLKGLADFGNTLFVDTLSEICTLSGAEDSDVCDGSIALEGPIIAQALRGMDIGSKTSELFCITFMGLCSYPAVDASPVTFPSPKPGNGRPAPSGQDPIQIIHYSDIHVDPFYVPGSNTDCSKPICCRDYDSADAPGNNNSPAGPNGDHKCDSPMSLEESMYAAIHNQFPNAAFTIFTGDIVDHAVWNTTQAQNTIDINNAYSKMSSSGMNLVYGVTGNHEMSPTNAFPPSSVGNEANWVYNTLATDWAPWIGSGSTSSVQSFGAYSTMYPGGNLRIISVNTNLFYIDDYYLYTDPMETDPSGQWAWLVTQLNEAEQASQRVYIIGHMPPGVSDAFHDGSTYFDQIVNRYSSTIAGMFFGHTHLDHFQVSYSDYNNRVYSNAVAASYIMPSLTPTSGMPAFRVYSVDPVTFAVLDATTYMADMTNPAFQTTGPVWTEYYSATAAYGPLVSPPLPAGAELSPAFWHNVTAALAGNQDAFNDYYPRKSRGWNVSSCTGSCMTTEICQLQAANSVYNCYTPTPGISFNKRDEVGGHREECGVSVARSTIASLVVQRDSLALLETRFKEKRAVYG